MPATCRHPMSCSSWFDSWVGCRWSTLLPVASPPRPTPALMMRLGCDGIFVGSGHIQSSDPAARAKAVVEATTYFADPKRLADCSKGLGEAMKGLQIDKAGPG